MSDLISDLNQKPQLQVPDYHNIKLHSIKALENDTALKWLSFKCNNLDGCSKWEPDLSIIGNVSISIGILLLNGENDSQSPVQQAFLLQQRLINVNHPDHTSRTRILSFITVFYELWAL
jgi:diaminopimelate decarboxylase